MNLDRFEKLVGESNVSRIRRLNILIVGLGGVGGYAFETLVRCGIENFTIIDGDKIDETNLNRQIITNLSNIGELKVSEAKKRAFSINSDVVIHDMCMFLNDSNFSMVDFSMFDYVVDACDDVNAKQLIINKCLENNVKIISSMGTARKMDASKIYITTLDKTSYDPLARSMRKKIDKSKQKNVVVVSSKEEPIDTLGLGSSSFVPATAGIFITNYIINDFLLFDN